MGTSHLVATKQSARTVRGHYLVSPMSVLTRIGYREVSDHCPMCEHRPFSQDLCKPYKAIRNTAKAFLKTHEKKLADERAKAVAAVEATSVATPVESEIKVPTSVSQDGTTGASASVIGYKQEEALENTTDLPLEDQPQPSIEVRRHLSPK